MSYLKNVWGIGTPRPTSKPHEGTMWYDSNTQRMMIYDGVGWRQMTKSRRLSVDELSHEQIEKLCDKYPALRSAYDEFCIVLKMCLSHESTDQNQ